MNIWDLESRNGIIHCCSILCYMWKMIYGSFDLLGVKYKLKTYKLDTFTLYIIVQYIKIKTLIWFYDICYAELGFFGFERNEQGMFNTASVIILS